MFEHELQDFSPPTSPSRVASANPSDETLASPSVEEQEPEQQRIDGLPTTEAPEGRLTFIRDKKGRYRSEQLVRLRNSMLLGIGFLEIANAGDFAANVFNLDPLPTYAIVLMACGGTLALSMLYFAITDARLSLINLKGLREERRFLKEQRQRYANDRPMLRTIDCFLDLNFREHGTEWVDRVGMDILLGTGALLVATGTFMAIDARNTRVAGVSQLFTGYIGNAPCALYGVLNLLWSCWVWRRATRHKHAALPRIRDKRIKELLKMRSSSVQFHGALNGLSGITAGVAALLTATMWWGYVILLPCLVISVLINCFWRNRVGYDRPYIKDLVVADDESILDSLTYIDECHRRVAYVSDSSPLSALVQNPNSLGSVLEFLTDNQLLEEFCLRVLRDDSLRNALFPGSPEKITISWRELTALADENPNKERLVQIAGDLIRDEAPNCFRHQERYLLEALGCYIFGTQQNNLDKAQEFANRRASNPNYRNARTDIGRHTNDWLFGGFSISQLIREAFVV